jgi:hypothetical protein
MLPTEGLLVGTAISHPATPALRITAITALAKADVLALPPRSAVWVPRSMATCNAVLEELRGGAVRWLMGPLVQPIQRTYRRHCRAGGFRRSDR